MPSSMGEEPTTFHPVAKSVSDNRAQPFQCSSRFRDDLNGLNKFGSVQHVHLRHGKPPKYLTY